MNRALRITHWPSPNTPTLIGMMESDMKVSAEEAVEEMLTSGHGFFTYDIFDCEGDSFEQATVEAITRAQAAEINERDMAIAYHWYGQGISLTMPKGTIMSDRPAPLSREQMAWVFRSLAYHPEYKGQKIHVPLTDGTTIEMKNGEVLPTA